MSQEIIERVARAICKADCEAEAKRLGECLNCDCWETFEPQVRAAIAVMREPTLEMLKVASETEGIKAVDSCIHMSAIHGMPLGEKHLPPNSPLKQAWQAMIDEILNA